MFSRVITELLYFVGLMLGNSICFEIVSNLFMVFLPRTHRMTPSERKKTPHTGTGAVTAGNSGGSVRNSAVQSQKAVFAYFTSKHILPFGFSEQRSCHPVHGCIVRISNEQTDPDSGAPTRLKSPRSRDRDNLTESRPYSDLSFEMH